VLTTALTPLSCEELMYLKIALYILATLPMLIYPGILMAGIMGLAAHTKPDIPALLLISSKTFLISSLCYPISWFIGMFMFPFRYAAVIPLAHLAVCLVSFGMWYALSK
jgi:hypothetical protein